jgi:hypothetical protein
MGLFKIFFSRTTWSILIRLGTNHSWRERIQVPLEEGNIPSPKGDNNERVKYTENFYKSSSTEPESQNQSNLIQIILW